MFISFHYIILIDLVVVVCKKIEGKDCYISLFYYSQDKLTYSRTMVPDKLAVYTLHLIYFAAKHRNKKCYLTL